MPPRKSSANASTGAPKRKLDNEEDHAPTSPLRKSKRTRSSTESKAEPADEHTEQVEIPSRKRVSKTKAVKKEVTEEEEQSVDIKTEEVETKQNPETKAAEPKPSGKKRQTKKEAEAEMVPLRARTQGLNMFVGAHVSAAKGVFNATTNSAHIGGNAFALFLKSQRKWDNPPLQDDVRDQFRQMCKDHKYDATKHILPHGSYLVNLAQEDKAKAQQAYDSFLDDLRRCESLGITLYNFHPGSANQSPFPSALTRLANALTAALTATSTVIPVLETMCGHGSTIGSHLSEFRTILSQIPRSLHPRIGICIDTCHSFAAGYDLCEPAAFNAFLDEFDATIGLHHLKALHLNDSKAPRGSHRDLHANIGTGFLGLRAFHSVMNEKRFEGLPLILETPIDVDASTLKNENETETEIEKKSTSNSKAKPKAKPSTVADPGVWAREIALLESLIGMDAESAEFKALEAKLAEEGRESREKHMEQFERKKEAEEKKKKGKGKGQKTLMEMMNGSAKKGKGKAGRKSKKDDDEEEEGSEDEEGCQSHGEE